MGGIADIYADFYREFLDMYPSMGSYLGHRQYDDRYENFLSKSLSSKWKELMKRYKLRAHNTRDSSVHAKAFLWFLNNELYQYTNLWLIPLTPFDNAITSMVFSNRKFYPLHSQHDVRNLAIRYQQMIKIITTCRAIMKEGIRRKVVLPKMLCGLLLKDLKTFYENKDYIIKVPNSMITEHYRDVLVEYASCLAHFIGFIEKEYLPKCRRTLGLCHLPNGRKNYEKIVKGETTLDVTPQEIFAYGQEEVDRIRGEFSKVKHQLGHHDLNFKEFCNKVMKDSNHYPKSVEQLMAYYEAQRKRIRHTVIKENFYDSIKDTYRILAVPNDMQDSSVAAFYYAGNYKKHKKGHKNVHGTFYVNTRNLQESPLYSAYVLSLHEGEPGHHYQFEYMIEKNIPEYSVFAFNSDGFVEGWALYAETLGDYSPLERFGKLTYEMLRAVRLVVDVGIHYYGWSWTKALMYMQKHIPMQVSELTSELIRYVSIPGQAVAYKMGERCFKQLRDTFLCINKDKSIKDFHEAVLENGIIPLEVLKDHFKHKHKTIV